jgi:hemerythrin-like metal-binding protein
MAFFNWNDNLSVGVKASDDDHKKLSDMLNRLYEGMKSGQGKEVVGKVLDDLVSYTKFHFAREEEFFAKTGYPAVEHKKEHKDLVKQAEELQSRYKSGETALSIATLDFLKDWLTVHIQGTDKKYSSHLNANGIC